jgi:curved DNA-binding protein CbpA
MTDHFATLNLPRQANLDPEQIKARFHELSRELHPDANNTTDSQAFTKLNTAQSTLTRVSTRLRHIFELETGAPQPRDNAMSAKLMDLFSNIADTIAKADTHIAKKQKITTVLAKAMLAKSEPAIIHAIMLTGGAIESYKKALTEKLPAIDTTEGEQKTKTIATLAHEFSFIEKWQAQIQERMAAML